MPFMQGHAIDAVEAKAKEISSGTIKCAVEFTHRTSTETANPGTVSSVTQHHLHLVLRWGGGGWVTHMIR